MLRIKNKLCSIGMLLVLSPINLWSQSLISQKIGALPNIHSESSAKDIDWLIEPVNMESGIYQSEDKKDIIISNGLISRTIRVVPNAATVGLDNLMTGESVLRGVKPEARIVLDGQAFDVGGLEGQPNYAYITREWIEDLTDNPAAFHLIDVEQGPIEVRLEWKKTRHAAPDSEWPPKGKHLEMHYKLPEVKPETFASGPQPSDLGRKLMFSDNFSALNPVWSTHYSTANPRSSFENEGKVGEIYTPANTFVFVEKTFTPGTKIIETVIDAGTDRSKSWGPGIALEYDNGIIKFNLRPGGNNYDNSPMFGTWNGRRENPSAGGRQELDISRPWFLRLRIEDQSIHCEAKQEGGEWKTYSTISTDPSLGSPKSVRIGKMSPGGTAEDASDPGELVRMHVLAYNEYSDYDASAMDKVREIIEKLRQVKVTVHYEIYDGIPVMSKWLSVENNSGSTVRLEKFTSEILAAVEGESRVEDRGGPFKTPNMYVETEYSFGGMEGENTREHSVFWVEDPDYTTQVNYLRITPCLLEVRPEIGPDQWIQPGTSFESFRTWMLIHDSYDRERNSLARRKMYRVIAPWATENPLMMHIRKSDPESVKMAIDQCVDTGFEMAILSFGSGFNMENEDPAYLAELKELADYAHSKGIEIGGYSLLSSRRISPEDDVINPLTGKPGGVIHGNAPCLGSDWGADYMRKLYEFFEKTGMDLLEHDGSYPGHICASTTHKGHHGMNDSQWTQWRTITDYYKWCRSQGIYLNIPDWYYLTGGTKCGMGYREVNWSLPRAQQVIHTRQNIFDGTWSKTPSMGWMFVPLTQYHGGGAAATIEPLEEHLPHYEAMLTSNLGAGVQACYRGPRLYDSEKTKALVKEKVAWYKKYRDILESDIIHTSCRRADGKDIDWMFHANPDLKHKGFLMVYNPTKEDVTREIKLDIYYTGLDRKAKVTGSDGLQVLEDIDRNYNIVLKASVTAGGYTWFLIE